MCRFLCYVGSPTLVADIVLWPDRSIIKQSYDAKERLNCPWLPNHMGCGALNGDGFGVGWYGALDIQQKQLIHGSWQLQKGLNVEDEVPCVFTSITPAWNNENLGRLATHIVSPLIFAHVRAASPSIPVSQQNCHPFQEGIYLFMHNGQITSFYKLHRQFIAKLSDKSYATVKSFNSDSAYSFALFLNYLPTTDYRKILTPQQLMEALLKTVNTIVEVQKENKVEELNLLNFVVSNGTTTLATRYVWPETQEAATMYYAEGASFKRSTLPSKILQSQKPMIKTESLVNESQYQVEYGAVSTKMVMVASEPITNSEHDWVNLKKNTGVIILKQRNGNLVTFRFPIQSHHQDKACDRVKSCLGNFVEQNYNKQDSNVNLQNGSINNVLATKPQQDSAFILTSPRKIQEASNGYNFQTKFYSAIMDGNETAQDLKNKLIQNLNDQLGALQIQGGNSEDATTFNKLDGTLSSVRDSKQPDTNQQLQGVQQQSMYNENTLTNQDVIIEQKLTGHHGAITRLCRSHGINDQELLITAGEDRKIMIWNIPEQRRMETIEVHLNPISVLVAYENMLISASGRRIVFMNLENYEILFNFWTKKFVGPVRAVAYLHNAIFVSNCDNKIRKYVINRPQKKQLSTFQQVFKLPTPNTTATTATTTNATPTPNANANANSNVAQGVQSQGPFEGNWVEAKQEQNNGGCGSDNGNSSSIHKGLGLQATNLGSFNSMFNGQVQDRRQSESQEPQSRSQLSFQMNSQNKNKNLQPQVLPRDHSLDYDYIKAQPQAQEQSKDYYAVDNDSLGFQETELSEEHCGTVTCLKLYLDYVISAGTDGYIKVWDSECLRPVVTLNPPHKGCINSMYIFKSTLFSVGEDSLVRIWDLETFTCRRTLKGHKDSILDISASLQLQQNYTTSKRSAKVSSRKVDLSDQEDDQPQFQIDSLNQDGKSSKNGKSDQFCKVNGEDLESDHSPTMSVTSSQVFLSGYPKYIITCSQDRCIRIWSSYSWTCEQKFEVNDQYQIISCDIVGNFIVAGTLQGSILFWVMGFKQQEEPRANSKELLSSSYVSQYLRRSSVDLLPGQQLQNGRTNQYGMQDLQTLQRASTMQSQDFNINGYKPSKLQSIDYMQQSPQFSSTFFRCGSQKMMGYEVDPYIELQYRLKQFISIPTVSQDIQFKDYCHQGAKFIGLLLDSIGAEVKLVQSKEHMNPVVLGRIQSRANLPKVTFYGHYDVQPALESDWNSDPFHLTVVDGYMYGRGVSDNKGPILSFIYAVKEILKETRLSDHRSDKLSKLQQVLPFNVAFIFEGEEENGSMGFQEVVNEYKDWFDNTSFSIISNTTWVGEKVPCITYGLRGMITLRIEVTGPNKSIHSGNDGGVFNEPMMDLLKILSTLVDNKSNILVPGFYDGTEEGQSFVDMKALLDSNEFNVEQYQKTLGVPELTTHSSAVEVLRARWCLPCMSIVGIQDGTMSNEYSQKIRRGSGDAEDYRGQDQQQKFEGILRYGPTQYSVISKSKIGEISIRYVNNQDPHHLISQFKRHVQHEFAKLRSKNKVQIHVKNIGQAWQAKNSCQALKIAEKVIHKAWGIEPLYVREGGTLSLASVLENSIGAPVLMLPMGQASDNYHLANERMRVLNLQKGQEIFKNILSELKHK